jgi:hypothetical protein
MEPEGSLPCSQQTLTGPYPEPNTSNLHLPSCVPKTPSNIIFPYTPRSSKWSLPPGFPTKILCAFLITPIHATFPAISSSLIWSDIHFPLPRSFRRIRPNPRPCVTFHKKLLLLWGVVSPSLNPEAGGPPLFSCPWLLIQYIRSSHYIWRQSLLSATRRRAMSWWKGPT